MPCGGVHPCRVPAPLGVNNCFWCGQGGCAHFYIEFDAYVHARCFIANLIIANSEARIAISHKHEIVLDTTRDIE